MKLEAKQLIEIIGIVALVASLVFVGMQLQLDRRAAVGEQYSNRAQAWQAVLQSELESDEYLATFSKRWENGDRPAWWTDDNRITGKNSTPTDVEVLRLTWSMLLTGQDNLYFQYQQGLLQEEQWQFQRASMKRRLRDQAFRTFATDPEINVWPLLDLYNEIAEEIDNEE